MTISLPYGDFEVYEHDHMNEQIATERFWDVDMQPFLDRVPSGARVVDVGAHVGLYSGYWAANGVRAIAFEAHPSYVRLLIKNVERNHWETMIGVIPVFLYSRSCWLGEVQEHETPASNTWLPVAEGSYVDGQRHALTLDMFELGKIDCLKVDAQGADLHVLYGAGATIERWRPLILIEFESALAIKHGHISDDYHRWAKDHHYKEVPINGNNCCLEPC